MTQLPHFVAVPLAAAFILPLLGSLGRKSRTAATIVANMTSLTLLVMAVMVVGRSGAYAIGKWPIPLGINLVLDGLSSLLLVAVSVVGAAAMLFSWQYMEQYTAKPKFYSLFLLMVAGMNGVILSGDIFNLFVFLEIASIASYALVGFGCGHEELEASFKYMVLGSISSMFILFGVALVYGNTGSLNMACIARIIDDAGLNPGLMLATAMFIAGFSLKAAMVPFHSWLPDAHPSAPAPISAMLSGVLIKALGIYALCRVLFNVLGVTLPVAWILVAMGVLSMVVGVFLAVGQWDFKRLLAYHSISQMGYVVLGVGMGAMILAGGGNPAWASLAILGGLFHMVNHAVFKSLLFLTSGSVEMSTGTRQLKEMGGLAEKMPVTGTTCTIASAAIAGVPPFNGFWSKLILVVAAGQAGMWWLAVAIVLVSIVTLISFLKVRRYAFLGAVKPAMEKTVEYRGGMAVSMAALALLCVFMGLLVLIPPLRKTILDPAVDVMVDGLNYSSRVIGLLK